MISAYNKLLRFIVFISVLKHHDVAPESCWKSVECGKSLDGLTMPAP
jgi:hypothetical protein